MKAKKERKMETEKRSMLFSLCGNCFGQCSGGAQVQCNPWKVAEDVHWSVTEMIHKPLYARGHHWRNPE